MIRRFGEPVRGEIKYKPRPGAYGILLQNNRLLVTLQSEPTVEYQLPGGGIDPGESPAQALHREVLEETGWKISNPRRLGVFRRFTFMPEYNFWAEKICHVYLARPTHQIHDPIEPFHTAHWMEIDQAAAILGNAGDRHFVSRLLV